MRYAVISDVHANKEALESVLADAAANGAECVACLGDVVGYGPLPKETLRLVRERAAVVVKGNHDAAVANAADAENFIDLALDAVERHRAALDSADIEWLKSLPYRAEIEGAALAHGDLVDPKAFYYIDDEAAARANFAAASAQLLFVGHTHEPCVFLTGQSGRVYRLDATDFEVEPGKRYIVNPGSVGYPRERDGKCLSSYVLYDSREKTVRFRFIAFAVASMLQRGAAKAPRKRPAVLAGAAVAAAVALVAAVAAYFAAPQRAEGGAAEGGAAEAPTSAQMDAAMVIERREIALGGGAAAINPNLALVTKPPSPPVNLQVDYFGESGECLFSENCIVKQKKMKIEIPKCARAAARAVLTLRKASHADKPAIKTFAPALIDKTL